MRSIRLIVFGISLMICILSVVVAAGAAQDALGGDILLDTCGFDSTEAAQAVWKPIDGSLPVGITEFAGRRALLLPGGFVDRPTLTVARWQRDLAIDLTGRLGLQIDVHCSEPGAVRSVGLCLLDANGDRFAEAALPVVPGWNTITVSRPEAHDEAVDAKWAMIRGVGITVTPARRTNVRLAAANLRVVGPDPLISLMRLRSHDCIDLRDGEIIRGTLQNEWYALNTRFGRLTFDAKHVVGLRSIRRSGSMVQILLTDGEVFTGTLVEGKIQLAMTIGEAMTVPVHRIRQCAYRIGPDRPLYRMPRRPVLQFAENRVAFKLADDFHFALTTAHGEIALPPAMLARLEALGDGTGRWRATLRNGSALVGALGPPRISAALPLPDERNQPVQIIIGQVKRFRWPCPIEPPADATIVELSDDQRLYGRIGTETLAVKAQFGPQDVPVSDIVSMTLSAVDTGLATVNLWGGEVLRGRLLDSVIPFALMGLDVTVALKADQIRSITSAGALSTRQFAAKIERLIRHLDSQLETERRAAYEELIRTGPPAVPLIKQHLGDRNPFIRRRLLEILAQIG